MESGRRLAERRARAQAVSKHTGLAIRQRWLWLIGGAIILTVVLVDIRTQPAILQPLAPRGVSSQNLVLVPPTPACVATRARNPIAAENACPGAASWQRDLPFGPSNAINAFPVPGSVTSGQTVRFYVSTTAISYSFSVYRVGWYQGRGARLLYTSPRIQGINQPAPLVDPATRAASCANWRLPVTLLVPTSWVSGVYLVKFVTSAHDMRYTLFVVRDDASHAPVLFQMALATYQAYNNYGGRSLYGYNSGDGRDYGQLDDRAYAVSFDRPYNGAGGLGFLPSFEGPLIRFLERNGYNMTYMADVDLALHPQPLLHHKLLIVGGHDEYWSASMRQAVTNARNHGVSLAFFSADDLGWQVRLANSPLGPDRVVICYKDARLDPLRQRDPAAVTVHWADPPISQPQNSLLGELYNGIPRQPVPLVLAPGALPYLTGTRLHPGSALPGLVYGEIDVYVKNGFQPPNVTILAASPVLCVEGPRVTLSNATIYTAPSGAKVFDAGTFDWYLGLNAPWIPSPHVAPGDRPDDFERLTLNILAHLLAAASSASRVGPAA